MMLRGSSEAKGDTIDLQAIVAGRDVDSHVSGGVVLIRFTEAALTNSGDLSAARSAMVAEFDEQKLVDAAGVIGNFQRMVRIADSTGIPVDGPMAEMSASVREELGLNDLPSARLST